MELRELPQVDALARHPLLAGFPEAVRIASASAAIAAARDRIRSGFTDPIDLAADAFAFAERRLTHSPRRVINMTGVVLHTGLGRARMPRPVADRIAEVAANYTDLEFDVERGERGNRQSHVRPLLHELTGAEDHLVVNNAAGAVVLALAALGEGREVVLSRGQMVEIGGAFRMPEIVRASGCRLVEVGCTNRTYLRDYEAATTSETAIWLRCHPSNYRVIGFTAEPDLDELAPAARERGVLLIDDQGNGQLGSPTRPEVFNHAVRFADVAIASGDKLIGASQAGILAGRKELIAKIARHPLARALRIDKLQLAALEATLRLHATGRSEELPTFRALTRPLEEVRQTAEILAEGVPEAIVESGSTEVGSGAEPGTEVATWRIGLPESWSSRLRAGDPPIVGRLESGRLWLDPRTLDEAEIPEVRRALEGLRNA
jgi:L-seryl-tRNA(Ser) seleniumtransferase